MAKKTKIKIGTESYYMHKNALCSDCKASGSCKNESDKSSSGEFDFFYCIDTFKVLRSIRKKKDDTKRTKK